MQQNRETIQEEYNHIEVENRWKKNWLQANLYKTPQIFKGDKKKYILFAFAYPSGSGLHVGHCKPYTAVDIVARYYKLNGFKVLNPTGWDAFGLPAEGYAIKTGVHPLDSTNDAINRYKQQIDNIGLATDWDREIATHQQQYYKWTQWIFSLLYKKNLAYKKEALVNWDPVDKTVLANEQVLPDGTSERSGALVEQKMMSQWFFKITDYAQRLLDDLDDLNWPESTKIMQRNWIGRSEGAEVEFEVKNCEERISVFTTAHDTIFGVTFLVIAPEHELINLLTTTDKKASVEEYIQRSKKKTQFERTELNKDKTGVFTGSFAINPINGKEIEIWVADYVLTTYGTGAVMAVPGEDERDYEFANKYNLPIIYTNNTNSHLSYSKEIKPNSDKYTLINSGKFNGLTFLQARKAILEELQNLNCGQTKTTYKIRDWLVSRQRYWGSPIPIVYSPNGEQILVENLPVTLPYNVEFKPTGRSPLLDSDEFITSTVSQYGEGFLPEFDTMDTFVCSSWYFFRFMDPNNANEFASKEEVEKWGPVDEYIIGAEHTVLHLLYSRFFTKVLFDEGYINFNEPFLRVSHPGMLLGNDTRKMSKRWGNVVNPTDICNQYGADSLRLYEMFMGPFKDSIPWSDTAIKGVKRFVDRVWKLQYKVVSSPENNADNSKQEKLVEAQLNNLILKVSQDIANYSFNTTVAQYMKFVNFVESSGFISKSQLSSFLIILSPFAPFITEELWHILGNKDSIYNAQYPKYDPDLELLQAKTIVVQIDGKVRASFEVESNTSPEQVLLEAKQKVSNYLEGKEIVFEKVIPGRMVSFSLKK